MTQQKTDRLVEDYLGAVSYACAELPPQRRDELVEDLREHITAARAVLYEPTEAAVRTILDRLGEPSAIAEEALLTEPKSVPKSVPEGQKAVPEARRSSTTALGLVLGFVLIIVVMIVAATAVILGLG